MFASAAQLYFALFLAALALALITHELYDAFQRSSLRRLRARRAWAYGETAGEIGRLTTQIRSLILARRRQHRCRRAHRRSNIRSARNYRDHWLEAQW